MTSKTYDLTHVDQLMLFSDVSLLGENTVAEKEMLKAAGAAWVSGHFISIIRPPGLHYLLQGLIPPEELTLSLTKQTFNDKQPPLKTYTQARSYTLFYNTQYSLDSLHQSADFSASLICVQKCYVQRNSPPCFQLRGSLEFVLLVRGCTEAILGMDFHWLKAKTVCRLNMLKGRTDAAWFIGFV